jgi:hypothetical protein
MSKCVHLDCPNFGNPKKSGYCNSHASSLGIKETDIRSICPHALCHVEMRGSGFGGPTITVNGLELPNGFTRIVERIPIPGDVILSRVEVSQGYNFWMSNSYGRVATVNEADGTALIHFACDSLLSLSYAEGQFVVIE